VTRKITSAVMPLVVFGALIAFGYLPGIPLLAQAGKALGPYGYSFIANTVWIVVPILALTVARRSFRAALEELGILANPLRPLFFGFVATLPAAIGFALTAHVDPSVTPRAFFLLCLYSPFAEEVLFRAFAFGQLYERARWNFLAAALVPAVLFAAGHASQSRDPAELAGILAITVLGAFVFSYFFIRFRRNIWAPFALHALLNTWWTIFTVNQTALGGLSDNIFRFGSIGLAFGLAYSASYLGAFRIFAPKNGAWRSVAA